MNKYIIPQSSIGLLYEDGVFIKTLNPGKHKFHFNLFKRATRSVKLIDIRERSLTIKGQEILTADKVAIRVSLLVYYKVKDPVGAAHNVSNYEERIYEDVQLSARRYLASKNLDAILKDRNEISDTVREDVKGPAESYGVEILRADIKDLIFPGNLREIMNQVLETERRAEAKLIESKKEAEAARIKNDAENEARIRQLEAEKKQAKLRSETEKAQLKLKLETEIEEAEAIVKRPEILKLKQLQVLQELAKSGQGKFVLGLSSQEICSLLDDNDKKGK